MPKKSSKLTLKEISNLSQYELGKMSKKELQAAYRDIRQAVQRRQKVFEKHNAGNAVPKSVRDLKAPSRLNKKDLMKSIAAAGNFYQGPRGTYTGYKRELKKITETIKSRTDVQLGIGDLPDLGLFLKEAKDRTGDMYDFKYKELVALYEASKNKNLDPSSLLRNYEYWTEEKNLQALKEAQPIRRTGKVHPSDYVKKLGLQPIGKYYLDDD